MFNGYHNNISNFFIILPIFSFIYMIKKIKNKYYISLINNGNFDLVFSLLKNKKYIDEDIFNVLNMRYISVQTLFSYQQKKLIIFYDHARLFIDVSMTDNSKLLRIINYIKKLINSYLIMFKKDKSYIQQFPYTTNLKHHGRDHIYNNLLYYVKNKKFDLETISDLI